MVKIKLLHAPGPLTEKGVEALRSMLATLLLRADYYGDFTVEIRGPMASSHTTQGVEIGGTVKKNVRLNVQPEAAGTRVSVLVHRPQGIPPEEFFRRLSETVNGPAKAASVQKVVPKSSDLPLVDLSTLDEAALIRMYLDLDEEVSLVSDRLKRNRDRITVMIVDLELTAQEMLRLEKHLSKIRHESVRLEQLLASLRSEVENDGRELERLNQRKEMLEGRAEHDLRMKRVVDARREDVEGQRTEHDRRLLRVAQNMFASVADLTEDDAREVAEKLLQLAKEKTQRS